MDNREVNNAAEIVWEVSFNILILLMQWSLSVLESTVSDSSLPQSSVESF